MTFEDFIERFNAEEEARELAAALCAVRTAHLMKKAEKIWNDFHKKQKVTK